MKMKNYFFSHFSDNKDVTGPNASLPKHKK